MKKISKIVSFVLVAVMLLGAVPAYAAGGNSAGLNGDSGKWAEFDESGYDEVISISTIKNAVVNGYTWPASGTILIKESSSTYTLTGSKPNCIGITIPAGLVVDIYKYYQSAGMSEPVYKLLGHFDTTNGSAYTIGSTTGTSTGSTTSTVAGFTDVRSTDYYADAVKWAKETGVTAGTNAAGTAFSPKATVTRAEAMTFLWRAAGCPEPASQTSPYTDVADPGAYYYKPVLWAAEQGITSGVGGNRFGVLDTLAYDQILTFLCRAAGVSASGSDWSSVAVNWATQNGLTDGLSFSPKDNCPRADMVYFLWNQLADEQSSEKEEQAEVPVGLSDEEGVKAAIINGFLEQSSQIAVSAYNVEVSRMLELAEEIADTDGENPYNITSIACGQMEGRRALFLQVFYQIQVSSSLYETSEEIRQLADEVVKDVVTSDMSDYDIAKALHDWLVLNCRYDERLFSGNMPYDSYTAYGPLKYGTSVCAGYAKAYLALLESAGMEAEYVTGNTTAGYHAWNVVKIDGEWYHVDTTWDDPIPHREGYIRYNYFLKSDSYMSKDHSNWSTKHSCTSTKYDGILPDTTEQARLEAQKAEQERLDGVADQVIAFLYESIDSLPYRTADELQAAETLTSNDAYPKISFPSGRFSASDLSKIRDQLKTAISERYPDYELMSLNSSSCQIKRNDVLTEIARKNTIQKEEQARQEQEKQAETDARVAAIEALLQEAIQNGSAARYSFTVPGDYTYAEIQQACKNMSASGYRFGDYTKDDYNLSAKYADKSVTISNYKWQADEELHKKQEEQEEQARIEAMPAAIVEYCYEAMADFPTIEELQSVAKLTSQHSYPTINIPSDMRSTDGTVSNAIMQQAKALLEEGISDKYPDYEVYCIAGWGFTIQRNDVLAEMERRKTAILEEHESQKQEQRESLEQEEPELQQSEAQNQAA